MAEVTRSLDALNANAFIPTIWSAILVDEYIAKAVISDKVDRRFEANLKYGDTVTRGSLSKVTPKQRQANTDLTYNTVLETSTNITVNQDWYVFRMIEPLTKVQSMVDLLMQYTSVDAAALGEKIDTTVSALFKTLNSSTRKGALATDVEDDNLIDCKTSLDSYLVPFELRNWFISPETWGSLVKIDKFVNLDYVMPVAGMTAAESSKLNRPIYGAPVIVANTLEGNAGNHNCALVQRDAIMLIIQQDPKVVKAWDTRRGADTLLSEAYWGVAEARDRNGICLQGK